MQRRFRFGAILLLLCAVALAAGCAASAPTMIPGATGPARKLQVVTTVAPISNIVRNVGGTAIELHGLIPDGVDSHTFEPAPSHGKLLADADLIVLNGLHLETPMERLALANQKPGVVILKLGEKTIAPDDWIYDFSFPREQGDPNPHLWLNVAYAMRYTELVRDALIQLDPKDEAYFAENARKYLGLLTRLDQGIAAVAATVPPEQRKLLTYHDSWSYFARRYGFTVVGAVQPTDFGEPSAREVALLIAELKQEKVPALFGSEVFPSKVMEQISRETGVRYVDSLRDDQLPGEPGAPEHTYVGMMLSNLRAIIPALGGRADALEDIAAKDTFTP